MSDSDETKTTAEKTPTELNPLEKKKLEASITRMISTKPNFPTVPSNPVPVQQPPPEPVQQHITIQTAPSLKWPIGVSRELLQCGKFRLQSYLSAPEVITNSKNTYRVISHCVLMLIYNTGTYTRDAFKGSSYKITLRNFKQTLRFFQAIYDWFIAEPYRDIFFQDEETGRFMVDIRATQLKLHTGGDNRYDQMAMEAVPAVYQNDSEIREGCALTINNTANTGILRDLDIESILGIMENFSFQSETILLLDILSHQELWKTTNGTDLQTPQNQLKTGKVFWQ